MGARPRRKVPERPQNSGPPPSPPQKYLYGQYFSRADVVDLILGFCVKKSDLDILDPSCGNGIFLLRAFARLKYLNPHLDPTNILHNLWGTDVENSLAAETRAKLLELTGIPLSNKSSSNSVPKIVTVDFFNCEPASGNPPENVKDADNKFATNGLMFLPPMGAIIGNPPYTRQEVLGNHTFGKDYKDKLGAVIKRDFDLTISARAGIYAYFLLHSTIFLGEHSHGRLGFVTLRSWLDVDFGLALKQFILGHYKIVAIIQSLREKWFPDAQMIPCILILERASDSIAREEHVTKFVQLREDLSKILNSSLDNIDQTHSETTWASIDQFVNFIEDLPATGVFKSETEENLQEILIRESSFFRVLGICQKRLDPAKKWGVFLGAPTIYFKILENAFSRQLLVPLRSILSKITPGIKSGANNFFYFPNIHHSITRWTDTHLILESKNPRKENAFAIEREYLSPILVKFKPQRSIFIQANDGYCLTITQPRGELEAADAKVVDYLQFGERTPPDQPYALRSTCQNRIAANPVRDWFNVAESPPAPLLHFEITTSREITFYFRPDLLDPILQKRMLVNYGFYLLFPARDEDAEVILALLNSTFGYLMLEFGGRYFENRDGTISNETRIGDLEKLPIINPGALRQDVRQKLIESIRQLGQRPVRKIWEELEQPDRHALDLIVFSEILGIPTSMIQEIYSSLGGITKDRNVKKK